MGSLQKCCNCYILFIMPPTRIVGRWFFNKYSRYNLRLAKNYVKPIFAHPMEYAVPGMI